MSKKSPPIIVLSGASGSGKTTLCRMAAAQFNFYYVVSHTTRPIRPSEKEGTDYHFVNESQFSEMINRGEFLEHARVYGHHYGTSKKLVSDHLQKGEGVILDLDTQGALAVKKLFPHCVLIFIKAPSVEDLETRLSKRGTETVATRQKRLQESKREESYQKYYDKVLINENLDKAYEDLEKIIKLHHDSKREKG